MEAAEEIGGLGVGEGFAFLFFGFGLREGHIGSEAGLDGLVMMSVFAGVCLKTCGGEAHICGSLAHVLLELVPVDKV